MLRGVVDAKLKEIGFEIRSIVCGNFTKNPVVKYFDHSIDGDLKNANYVNENGLYIGHHHYDIKEAIDELSSVLL